MQTAGDASCKSRGTALHILPVSVSCQLRDYLWNSVITVLIERGRGSAQLGEIVCGVPGRAGFGHVGPEHAANTQRARQGTCSLGRGFAAGDGADLFIGGERAAVFFHALAHTLTHTTFTTHHRHDGPRQDRPTD